MSQKEQLAKQLRELERDWWYGNRDMLRSFLEAAFLLGARARDQQLLESVQGTDDVHPLLEATAKCKPEELL